MQTYKPSYVSNNNTVTITLASLGNGSIATSSAIDNSTNQYGTYFLSGKFKTNAAGTSSTGTISIAIAASADGGSTYPTVFANTVLAAVIQATVNATTYHLNPVNVAALFGGILPSKIEVLVQNNTGAALDSTAANHGMWYEIEADTFTP